jgi:hypothetical protein
MRVLPARLPAQPLAQPVVGISLPAPCSNVAGHHLITISRVPSVFSGVSILRK